MGKSRTDFSLNIDTYANLGYRCSHRCGRTAKDRIYVLIASFLDTSDCPISRTVSHSTCHEQSKS
jgi:hypothetical protein